MEHLPQRENALADPHARVRGAGRAVPCIEHPQPADVRYSSPYAVPDPHPPMRHPQWPVGTNVEMHASSLVMDQRQASSCVNAASSATIAQPFSVCPDVSEKNPQGHKATCENLMIRDPEKVRKSVG